MNLQEAKAIVNNHHQLLNLITEAEGRVGVCKTSLKFIEENMKNFPAERYINGVEKAIIIKSKEMWEEAAAKWRNQAKEIEDNF